MAKQQNEDCFTLTENVLSVNGSVWYQERISLARPFDISFKAFFGCFDDGADGISFTLQQQSTNAGGIGGGLGVSGGYSLLFDQPEILLKTFEGWNVYRKYLNDPVLGKLRGNQINTWNGQWLSFVFGTDYKEDFDFARLEQIGVFASDAEKTEVNTVNWSRLFFSLSRQFPNESLTAYVYSLGQTNKTVGFIPFQFKAGNRLISVYKQLFSDAYTIDGKDFETLFGIHIKRACELGSVGLQALRPEKLKNYYENANNLSFKKEEDIITYRAFKTWLVAMLSKNKEEIITYTESIAEALLRYRNGGTGNTRKNLLEEKMFPAKLPKFFIEGLVQIIKEVDEKDALTFKQLKNDVHLMTNEEFGYFLTLLKFDYAYQERNFKN